MRLLDHPVTSAYALDVRIAGHNIRLDAPERVLSVLEATLLNVPRFEAGSTPDLTVVAQTNGDVWEVHGANGSRKVLSGRSAMPEVAGAIVTSAVTDTASAGNFRTLRATVMQRSGRALAMIGDDWESALTVAAHLHLRGWTYVGSDNALLDPQTLEVFAVEKSLYVNSSSLSHFPLEYRRAVEASPWYVTAQGIAFYAVNPTLHGKAAPWALSAQLDAVVVVDGTMGDQPAMESFDLHAVRTDRLTRLDLDWQRTAAGNLKLGGFVETADLVEHWFGSLPASCSTT